MLIFSWGRRIRALENRVGDLERVCGELILRQQDQDARTTRITIRQRFHEAVEARLYRLIEALRARIERLEQRDPDLATTQRIAVRTEVT